MPSPAPPPKTTKKHHARLNNPFPRAVPSGRHAHHQCTLSFAASTSKLAHAHAFPVGPHFRLLWNPSHGGTLSLLSPSSRVLWGTLPGHAFLSAASAATEAAESRGSFAVGDGRDRLAPDRQLVDKIRTFSRCDLDTTTSAAALLRAASFQETEHTRFPVLLITGLLSAKKADAPPCCGLRAKRPILSARYWILLEEKSDTQVVFAVRLGDYTWKSHHVNPTKPATPRAAHRSLRLRLSRVQRKNKLSGFPSREEFSGLLPPPPPEPPEAVEFNRVFLTYASEPEERFYGFGEQFSRMEFKGRRVPILVQEQGIGRGDQPITFAANLLSFR